MSKIFFISGVNGVGKSAVVPVLKSILPVDRYEVHEFDERGVPENAGNDWRISEVRYWLNESLKISEQRNMVICGFVKLSDFEDVNDPELPKIIKILLDAKPDVVMQRLVSRYTAYGSQKPAKPINFFIDGNVYILGEMRDSFREAGCVIIDTTDKTPEIVAKELIDVFQAE